MKKAYELSTLTGTQVLLLVASETGHVYTFATPKLQPLITKPEGKNLIQSCLNAAEVTPAASSPPHHPAPARIAHTQPQYNEPMLYPSSESIYPPPEHATTSSANYDKEDKDHRMPRNQQEMGNPGNSHIGLAYGAPFQNPQNMMNHPHVNMGGMNGYPASMPARYMPAPSHAPSAGNPNSGNNQYAGHPPYPSSVAGMLAQFPSPGFGGPSNSAYMWPNPSSHSGNNGPAPHAENSKGMNESHHSEDNLHQNATTHPST